MPRNKSAFLRYRIIDRCLTNEAHKFPNKDHLQKKIRHELNDSISTSMIDKDLAEMKRIYNAPIRFDKTHGGYYYTEAGFSIKEFPLTEAEVEALDFSTALFHQLKGTRLFEQFENAINKVIEGYRVSKILGKSELQILQVEEPVRAGGSEHLEVLLKSIVTQKALEISYTKYGGNEKIHVISPYLLKEYRNRWYLIGYSQKAKNILLMALDRINSIKKSAESYHHTENFNPEDFFKYSLGITQIHAAQPEEITLIFDFLQAQYILSQPLHHSQKVITQTTDTVTIQLKVYITPELIMTILGYGSNVQVIAPKHFRDTICQKIIEMGSKYK